MAINSEASGQWVSDEGLVTAPGEVAPDTSGSWVELPEPEYAGDHRLVYVPVPSRFGMKETLYVPVELNQARLWTQAVGVPVLDAIGFDAMVAEHRDVTPTSPDAFSPEFMPPVPASDPAMDPDVRGGVTFGGL